MHADRGSQYTSEAFTTLLDRIQAIASLSQPGNSYDYALAESSWGTLKTELLPHGAYFANLEEARLEPVEYLDHYYNRNGSIPPRATAPHSKSNATTFSTYLARFPFLPDHPRLSALS